MINCNSSLDCESLSKCICKGLEKKIQGQRMLDGKLIQTALVVANPLQSLTEIAFI